MAYSIMLDAGHGGTKDPGAVYKGRQEKDDNLRLVLAIGEILSDRGLDVMLQKVYLHLWNLLLPISKFVSCR